MHVPLRRRQIPMAGRLLNRPCRRAAHRQMRTERVTEHVRSVVEEARFLRRSSDVPPEPHLQSAAIRRPGKAPVVRAGDDDPEGPPSVAT